VAIHRTANNRTSVRQWEGPDGPDSATHRAPGGGARTSASNVRPADVAITTHHEMPDEPRVRPASAA
jgi:hypothetical protein